MVTYFVDKFKERYAVKPTVNRYAGRWGFDSLLEDMSTSEARDLVDYYFSTISTNGHSLEWFFYNYDKLAVAMEAARADEQANAVIRERTKRRTEEWRKQRGLED